MLVHLRVWKTEATYLCSGKGLFQSLHLWTAALVRDMNILLSFSSLTLSKARSCAYHHYQSSFKWIILTYSRFKYDWYGQSIAWYPQWPKGKSCLCFKEARICPILVGEVHTRAGKAVYIYKLEPVTSDYDCSFVARLCLEAPAMVDM